MLYSEDRSINGLVNFTSDYMNKNGISNVIFENKNFAIEYIYNNTGKIRNLVEFENNNSYIIYLNDTAEKGDAFNRFDDVYNRNGLSSITLKLLVYIIIYNK